MMKESAKTYQGKMQQEGRLEGGKKCQECVKERCHLFFSN